VSTPDRRVAELLAGHSFLAGLSDDTVALLADFARTTTFEPGEFLLREGEAADTIYLVTSGRVAIEIHAPARGAIVIDTVGPGHVVGLSWVAAPFRWQFDARALERVETVAIDAVRLSAEMAERPDVAAELHRRLSAVLLTRLQATRIRLLDLYANVDRD
jgi:CRP/FNR family transcriptional regulator, cyclic AMP receptor protein